MPEITATDFAALAQAARLWDLVPHGPPLAATAEERRASRGARSAFALLTYEGKPFLESCQCCGTWTASWCEGCYKEATLTPGHTFSAVCAECDQLKLVCPTCARNGHSWEEGNKVAPAETGSFPETAIAVTGFGVDAEMGRTVDELKSLCRCWRTLGSRLVVTWPTLGTMAAR